MDLVKLTTKHFARNEHVDVGSEEQGEDGPDHHEKKTYCRLLRTVPIGDPACNDQTDDLTSTRAVREAGLPCWRNLEFLRHWVPMAVLLVEDRRSVEVAEQCQIVTL